MPLPRPAGGGCHHLSSQSRSPVVQRKTAESHALKAMLQTPLQQKMNTVKLNLSPESPASPILGRRWLPLITGGSANVSSTQKRSASDTEASDKENRNALGKKSKSEGSLLLPLREKKNVTNLRNRTQGKEIQPKTTSKAVPAKRESPSDKENFAIPCETATVVRRSKRIKRETTPAPYALQCESKEKVPRKNGKLKVNNDNSVSVVAERKSNRIAQKKVSSPQTKDEEPAIKKKKSDSRVICLPISSKKNIERKKNPGLLCRKTAKQKSSDGKAKKMDNTSKKDSSPQAVCEGQDVKKMSCDGSVSCSSSSKKNIKVRKESSLLPRTTKQGSCDGKDTCFPGSSKKNVKVTKDDRRLSRQSDKQNTSVEGPIGKLSPSAAVQSNNAKSSVHHRSPVKSKGEQLNQLKLPVWASVASPKRTPGKRKSMRIVDRDVYEFAVPVTSPKVSKKKRVTKLRNKVKQKRPRPRTKLTLLTTDPNFERLPSLPPRTVSLSGSKKGIAFRRSASAEKPGSGESASSSAVPCIILDDDTLRSSAPSSIRLDDEASVTAEDSFDDHFDADRNEDQEDVFEQFDGETASFFVPSGVEGPSSAVSSVPMTSVSLLPPTPAISKPPSRYIGSSSTPRAETTESIEFQAPKDVKEDIAACFGFDSESDPEESDLHLSPVKRLGFNSCLDVTVNSDLGCTVSSSFQSHYVLGGVRPSNSSLLPSRYALGIAGPHIRKYASVSQSSSMMSQGGSVSALSVSSYTDKADKQSAPTSRGGKRTLEQRKGPSGNCKRNDSKTNRKARNAKPAPLKAKNGDGCSHNSSVLFDEEEDVNIQQNNNSEKQHEIQGKENSAAPPYCLVKNMQSQSPEKSFSNPPRKSYDRGALEESRRKFIQEYAGYSTEDEEVQPKEKPQKRKNQRKLKVPPKERKKRIAKPSRSTNDLTVSDSSSSKSGKSSKDKNEQSALEKSVVEWASSLNSHFSDVDDFELTVC